MITTGSDRKLLVAAIKRLELLRRREAFDPNNLESRPTDAQLSVLQEFSTIPQQWIRAGNQSGKSQVCAKLVAEVATERHPIVAIRRKDTDPMKSWGREAILIIVCGRTGKQLEETLLPKIASYLEPGTYKEVRAGNAIQRIELNNGNRIIFQSLENPNVARERVMSYVAHMTWVDELPPTMELVREIQIRTQARNGYGLFSFTPTVVNIEVQRYVDALAMPEARVYRFRMLDNPLYRDPERRQQVINRYAYLPQHVQNMIFEGDWMSSEDMVYYFDYKSMVEMPQGYSPMWRHVECVDPALKSALGLTIWAEHPETFIWYCVLAEYIRGIYVPTDLIETVRKKTAPYNIVRRISDPHEVWYIQQAGAMGITYQGVYKKTERKPELIKQLQEKLGSILRIAPLNCSDLISEFQECRYSDKVDGKIINSSSYHLLDTAQYFADNIPKAAVSPVRDFTLAKWYENLLIANTARLKAEEKPVSKSEARKMQIQRRARR